MRRVLRSPIFRPLVALLVVGAALTQPKEAHAVGFCGFYCGGLGCPTDRWSTCQTLFGGTCGIAAVCVEYDEFCGFTKVKCYGDVE